MENILNSQSIFNLHKSENLNTKSKILKKFRISEKKNIPIQLRSNHFIKIDSLPNRFLSKNSFKKKVSEDSFPLISNRKNITITNSPKLSKILTKKNMNINIINQSKEKFMNSTLLPKKIIKILDISKTINNSINNSNNNSINNTISETYNTKKYKNKNILFSQPKKKSSKFDNFFKKIDKNVKVIKLSKINLYNKKLIDELTKNDYSDNDNQEIFNPNKINVTNKSIFGYNNKLINSSKFTNLDISHDLLPKNSYFSRLNTFNRIISENIPKHEKEINSPKIFTKKDKLKDIHLRKMKECRKLIDNTVKEVNGVKNDCLNWVNELREEYKDEYEGYKFNTDELDI